MFLTGSHSGRASPTYFVGAVGTPSGSHTLSVLSDRIPEAPLENVIAIRVLVSSRIIPFAFPLFLLPGCSLRTLLLVLESGIQS